MKITTDLSHLVNELDLNAYANKVQEVHQMIENGDGAGHEYLGWLHLPSHISEEEIDHLEKTASYLRENYEILVVTGIGGSYLGARAAIEALNGVPAHKKPEIIYLGQTFDPEYTSCLLDYLKDKKFAVNVISKSGTTTETSVAFRLLRELLEKRDGKEKARKAIVATTDKEHGALRTLVEQEGYDSFVLPSDVGGRYSVLTPVGLLPIAVSGINIRELINGAIDAEKDTATPSITENEAYKYAVARHYLYSRKNLKAEFLISYSPFLVQLGEWWKQLFGESEGKDHKSLLPVSATFSTDLHSLGQFIQEGSKIFFETIIHFEKYRQDISLPFDEANLDGLNYLAGKSLSYIQEKAFQGVLQAHYESAHNNNIILNVEILDAYHLGYLFYFFEKSCAMSGYLNGVNPFNQPGVEVYKANMFKLLGKPGSK